MNNKTGKDYLTIADAFIKKHFADPSEVTPKKLTDALISAAPDYRPAYWRRLKCALQYQQSELGYKDSVIRLKKLRNPQFIHGKNGTYKLRDGSSIKSRQNRKKSVNNADEKKILSLLEDRKDFESYAVINICKHLGVRPAEIKNIRFKDNKFHIQGAKKNESGNRGLDRFIKVEASDNVIESIHLSIQLLKDKNDYEMSLIQKRIGNVSRTLFPNRKSHYTAYSWRHQMGSDLKSSKLSRKEMAYIMGHQSTASVSVYGDRRKGAGGLMRVRAIDQNAVEIVREKHTTPVNNNYPKTGNNINKSNNLNL